MLLLLLLLLLITLFFLIGEIDNTEEGEQEQEEEEEEEEIDELEEWGGGKFYAWEEMGMMEEGIWFIQNDAVCSAMAMPGTFQAGRYHNLKYCKIRIIIIRRFQEDFMNLHQGAKDSGKAVPRKLCR